MFVYHKSVHSWLFPASREELKRKEYINTFFFFKSTQAGIALHIFGQNWPTWYLYTTVFDGYVKHNHQMASTFCVASIAKKKNEIYNDTF